MAVRAIRGAVQVDANERDLILEATAELIEEVMRRNQLTTDDFISVLFTATQDLNAEFPALAARKLGFTDVPSSAPPRSQCRTPCPVWCGSWRTSKPTGPARNCTTSTCAAPKSCGWTSRSSRQREGGRAAVHRRVP